MRLKVRSDSIDIIRGDLDRKYLKSGYKLGGSVKEKRISLYVEDDHKKHSSFFNRYFDGRINGSFLEGKFRISLLPIILMCVLFAVCVESIIVAVISKSFESIIIPAIAIVFVIVYFASIKHFSNANEALIIKYLEGLKSEDSDT